MSGKEIKEEIASPKKTQARIKKVLKEQGNYTPDLEFMIEITAGNIYAYRLIMQDVQALSGSTHVEITRELNVKKFVEPALRALREQTESVRKCLRELRLTLASVEGAGDDELDDMIDAVNNIK